MGMWWRGERGCTSVLPPTVGLAKMSLDADSKLVDEAPSVDLYFPSPHTLLPSGN